jgi:hypothetical protein
MPGNPVFEAFCAKIEELGGEEYVFDKLRAGESVSQVAKGVDNRSRDMLYKWLWRGTRRGRMALKAGWTREPKRSRA